MDVLFMVLVILLVHDAHRVATPSIRAMNFFISVSSFPARRMVSASAAIGVLPLPCQRSMDAIHSLPQGDTDRTPLACAAWKCHPRFSQTLAFHPLPSVATRLRASLLAFP